MESIVGSIADWLLTGSIKFIASISTASGKPFDSSICNSPSIFYW